MNDATSDFETQGVRSHQVRDLIAALGRAVLWPFRWRIGVILLMQVVSQGVLVLSLILPWQLLQTLMTGHSRLEVRWPGSDGSGSTIALLVTLGVLCLGAWWLLQWLVGKTIRRLADAILTRRDKTRLVANHRLLARRSLVNVTGALSSALVALLFLLIVAWLYPVLALTLAASVAVLVAGVRRRYSFERIQPIQAALQRHVLTLINIGFVLGFTVIVLDHAGGALRSLPTLFIVLLSTRQLMAASVQAVIHFLSIIKRFERINLLLLPRARQIVLPQVTDFVRRFEPQALAHWLRPWLETQPGLGSAPVVCQCRLLGRREIAQVLIRHQGGAAPRHVLLKCYVSSRENEALHEALLLKALSGDDGDTTSVVPALIESGRLPWGYFLLLGVGDGAPQWQNSQARRPFMNTLRRRLCEVALPDTLVQRFNATFASLPERMRELEIAFDYLTSEDRKDFRVDRFQQLWPRMAAAVEKIPAFLTLDNAATARMADVDGNMRVTDWQGWVFDTLGAWWPLSAGLDKETCELVTAQWQDPAMRACWRRIETAECAARHVALAARAHEFCQRYRGGNDTGALNMLAGLIKAYEALDTIR